MVSGAITVLSALSGAFVGGILAQKTAEFREQKANHREYGKLYAEFEAEAVIDLSQKTTELYRFYLVNTRRAAAGYIDSEEYYNEIHLRYDEYEEALSRALPFLSEVGESQLWKYHESLVAADSYIREKVEAENPTFDDGTGDLDRFLQRDAKNSEVEFDVRKMELLHESLKTDIRDVVTESIDRFAR